MNLIGRGLHYCAHCDGRFYKGRNVVVVGGGNSAAADALYLSHLAKKVIVVHRRDELRATRIYHEPLMSADNIEFVWDSAVSDFTVDGRVNGVKVKNLKSGEESLVNCDGVFVSIGRKPATEFLENAVDDVIKATKKLGLVSIPGAYTPTEICNAYNWGADFIKLTQDILDAAIAANPTDITLLTLKNNI